jgi:hypothetical protein
MAYHFGGVVASQVLPIQEAFYAKISPKDTTEINTLNKLYARINKTGRDLCRARIASVYYDDSHRKNYDNLYTALANPKDDNERKKAEKIILEKMRKVWLLNLFEMISWESSGWNSVQVAQLERSLKYNNQIYADGEISGNSFISIEDINQLIKATRIKVKVYENDYELLKNKRRNSY